jgi:hypothetical protein
VAVLCRNENPSLNGGILCDYDYDDYQLANGPDEVILSLAGLQIDRVAYAQGGGWSPTSPSVGASYSLDPNAFSAAGNDSGGNWCAASVAYGDGDKGSPGTINPTCSGDPAVTGVSPSDGIDNGGDQVVIHGSGFTAVDGVDFDGAACTTWAIIDDNTITCTTPFHPAGDAVVTVTKGAASASLTAGYRFTGEAVTAIDWCDLQWPPSVTTQVGVPTVLIYGQVHSPGVTDPAGAPVGILPMVGYGPAGSDPRNAPGWTWTTATWERQFFANDEFKQTLAVGASGTFSVAYRFSDDAGYNFMYCDFDPGTADGFSTLDLGVLTVE